eukprot:293663_1
MSQTRSLLVSNAGFDDVNGTYIETAQNVFVLKRSDNNRQYQIAIDADTPFGNNVWSVKRIDGLTEICVYIATDKDIIDNPKSNWECVVGNEPYPVIESVSAKAAQTEKDKELSNFTNEQNKKRAHWKPKGDVLYWSRNKSNWLRAKIVSINDGFVCAQSAEDEEKKQNVEQVWIEMNSQLLQPQVDPSFYKRKLKKNQNVYVWSRNDLQWKSGIITDIQQDFVHVQCDTNAESRWIQR